MPERGTRELEDTDLFGPEYSVVSLGPSWSVASLACFVLSLGSRYWMRWVPVEQGWIRPWYVVLAMIVFSGLGAASGWMAQRRSRGLFDRVLFGANALAFVLAFLAVAIVFLILPPEYRPG